MLAERIEKAGLTGKGLVMGKAMVKGIVKTVQAGQLSFTAGKDFEEEYKTMQNIIQARHEKSYFSPVANVCGRWSK